MRTNLVGGVVFSGAVLGLLCLASTSFAGWTATDKALGHEGQAMRHRTYRALPAQQAYRAPVQRSYNAAPAMAAPATTVVNAAPVVAVPQVAATNNNTERRSFSVEPSAVPRSSNTRAPHQPSYTQADTKISGREGN